MLSLYRGKVTRATTAGIWVTISSTWPGVEFGPIDLVANDTETGGLADQIVKDDTVLIAETSPADFIVLGTIRKGVGA